MCRVVVVCVCSAIFRRYSSIHVVTSVGADGTQQSEKTYTMSFAEFHELAVECRLLSYTHILTDAKLQAIFQNVSSTASIIFCSCICGSAPCVEYAADD